MIISMFKAQRSSKASLPSR